ncbi:MAG TPA: chorismate mutase [Acetobacteraceae bacterium]|nr:chorismate mutase [Acetobacteraceae bacterium]
MSSPAPTDAPPAPVASADDPPPQDGWPGRLDALRAELDRIDNELHSLLLRRAAVVEQVAKSGKRSAYRPGREASILRRLLGQHSGALPPQTLVRIWREMLAGTTAMQAPFIIAVSEPEGSGMAEVAREHFGVLTPLRAFRRPAQALDEVRRGNASVAVLPMPSATETWWTALLRIEAPRLHIVGRLPFWAPRPEGAPSAPALVVAGSEPDASERDRSFIGLELGAGLGRGALTEALDAAGLTREATILLRENDSTTAQALVEVDGFVAADDPRLERLATKLARTMALGAYAVPEDGVAA